MSPPATLPVPALLLVGGRTSPEFAAAAGCENRALAEIGGRPMVGWVVEALRAAETVERVTVVAPPGFPEQPGVDLHVTADGSLPENIAAGWRAGCPEASHFLIVTGDLPFLTADAVDDYVRSCTAANVDCCFAAIPRAVCEQAFPGMRRTYVHVSGSTYTAGNLVFQRAAAYETLSRFLTEAHRRRKDPLFLAGMIGAKNVLRLLTRTLTLEHVEAAVSRLTGTRCRLIVSQYPEVGTDVDRPEDLVEARRRLTT